MEEKLISLTEIRKDLDILGYDLHLNKPDVFKVMHKYCTSNKCGSGGINYFDKKSDIVKWISDVQETRRILSC